MTQENLIGNIEQYARNFPENQQFYKTAIPGMVVVCDYAPTQFEGTIYDPVVCLDLQGHKETHIGDRVVKFGAGDSLIVSHTLPVLARITEASHEKPYIAMVLTIDLALARSLYDELGLEEFSCQECCSMRAAPADPRLIDAMHRLFDASLDAQEAKALAPMIIREIHYRLLQADHGGMLRQLLWRDSAASKISKVISRIRTDYAQAIPVADMARSVGMSVSAFHQHFKTVTAKSPLQYQKEIRLLEARKRITSGDATVASAAFDVGYESPTQFSREYSRQFGVSPRADRPQASAA